MEALITKNNKSYKVNLSEPIDISTVLDPKKIGASAWHSDKIIIKPVKMGGFVGSTLEGSPVNFNILEISPHGHGTHVECVGHITKERISINDRLKNFMFLAQLITVKPQQQNNDQVINEQCLRDQLSNLNQDDDVEALIIRTIPNTNEKLHHDYTNTNPPYFTKEAIDLINNLNIKHLLVDLPSVDKENDNGRLVAHKAFWNYPEINSFKTITEFVFVNNEVFDGLYLLQMSTLSIENDASPCKPIIYKTSIVS